MGHAYGDFVEVQHAYANENGHTEVFFPTSNTDFATYIHSDGHGLNLFNGRFHSADDRTVTYVGIRNDVLSLGCHDGGLKDFWQNVQELATEIDSHRAVSYTHLTLPTN